MPFILGTAGHIDHGKTALVKALTGINCDRLEEEKKRGITIELGFAWMDLADGQRLGIVDVPGHERFVKNMVAGAAGMDLVMLVIAADEGVMPQTREHLDICSLLGIHEGFVVLTKCDLVDKDWLALVQEDVASFLKGSFLEGAPILPVSSLTGEGLEELRAYISSRTHELRTRARSDIFRLPVDRVFSLRGFGTIVTGTIISGRVQKDRDAMLMPRGLATHIRTLQRHETPTEEAHAGERCAANLQGLEVTDIHRGDVLCLPGTLFPASRWVVNLHCLADSPMVIRNRTQLHFHHGTLETQARVLLLDRQQLKPGETCLAEIRFTEPLAGVFNDHCVLRSASPLRAVAGGALISPLPPVLSSREGNREEKLALLQKLADLARTASEADDVTLCDTVLALRDTELTPLAVLRVLTGLGAKRLDKALQTLTSGHRAICCDRESKACVGSEAFARLGELALARAHELHEKAPLQEGFARSAIAAGWAKDLAPRLVAKVLDSLVAGGHLVAAGDILKLPGRGVELDDKQTKLGAAMLNIYRKAGLTPPNLKDVLDMVRASEKEALAICKVLTARGDLVKIREGLYYSKEAFEDVLARVSTWFESHDDLTVADMKTLLGLSRKYLIPLLEYLDQERITVRIGDKRQFRNHQA